MERKKGSSKLAIFISTGLLLTLFSRTGPLTARAVEMSMGSGTASTSGYQAGVALSDFLNSRIQGLKLLPVELGTTAAIRRMSEGEMDLTLNNSFDLVGAHLSKGAFKRRPLKPGTQPYQGIWFWPAVMFMVARADSDIYSIDDLAGKSVSLGDPNLGLHAPSTAGFEALGVIQKWKQRRTTGSDVPLALKSKLLDALMVAVIGMDTPLPFALQEELRGKVRVLKMNRAQEDIINLTPGLSLMRVPSRLFGSEKRRGEIPGIGIMYGWSFAPSTDANLVYQFVKTCFENAPELESLARTFQMFSRDPKGTAKAGLKAASGVPVHPGAAKYYKEIGIWNASWKEGRAP